MTLSPTVPLSIRDRGRRGHVLRRFNDETMSRFNAFNALTIQRRTELPTSQLPSTVSLL